MAELRRCFEKKSQKLLYERLVELGIGDGKAHEIAGCLPDGICEFGSYAKYGMPVFRLSRRKMEKYYSRFGKY